MEGAITYPALAYFLALLVTGGGALAGVWAYIDRRMKALEKDLADYKLHVSEKFIKAGDLEKMEARLVATEARTLAALEQLTKRIDNLITEINAEHRRTTRSRQT